MVKIIAGEEEFNKNYMLLKNVEHSDYDSFKQALLNGMSINETFHTIDLINTHYYKYGVRLSLSTIIYLRNSQRFKNIIIAFKGPTSEELIENIKFLGNAVRQARKSFWNY